MNDDGYTPFVKEGDRVKRDDKLIAFGSEKRSRRRDIPGVTEKPDYLWELGKDYLWLSYLHVLFSTKQITGKISQNNRDLFGRCYPAFCALPA